VSTAAKWRKENKCECTKDLPGSGACGIIRQLCPGVDLFFLLDSEHCPNYYDDMSGKKKLRQKRN
jgi:hypothetical protein